MPCVPVPMTRSLQPPPWGWVLLFTLVQGNWFPQVSVGSLLYDPGWLYFCEHIVTGKRLDGYTLMFSWLLGNFHFSIFPN